MLVCVCDREREREKGGAKDRDKEIERDRERHREREWQRQEEREEQEGRRGGRTPQGRSAATAPAAVTPSPGAAPICSRHYDPLPLTKCCTPLGPRAQPVRLAREETEAQRTQVRSLVNTDLRR